MLNCFKYFVIYILEQNFPKNQTETFWTMSNCFKYSVIYILGYWSKKNQIRKIVNFYKDFSIISSLHVFSVPKRQDIHKYFWTISNLCVAKFFNTTDAHSNYFSVKIGSISYFSSSDIQKFHHLLGCHAISINSSFNSF